VGTNQFIGAKLVGVGTEKEGYAWYDDVSQQADMLLFCFFKLHSLSQVTCWPYWTPFNGATLWYLERMTSSTLQTVTAPQTKKAADIAFQVARAHTCA